MHYFLVAPVRAVKAGTPFFTYHCDDNLEPGSIVSIELGKKMEAGVVWQKVSKKPAFVTKPIVAVLEEQPLPHPLLKLAEWLSEYYATHLAVVLQTILPKGLGKTRRVSHAKSIAASRKRTNIVLNSEQRSALKEITESNNGTIVLHGVTGSGKTQVYIEASKNAVQNGCSVIVLVPEIALTSQLVAEFSQHFPEPIITHSHLTEAERHNEWRKALTSTEPVVVIGPRSALFTPVKKLGLIVIDECHEPSFKQEQNPKYSALRAASILAQAAKAPLVLGSATPSIADVYLAKAHNRPVVKLTKPALQDSAPPKVTLVDLSKKEYFGRHRFLSTPLLNAIDEAIATDKQALIFHNRRGSAPTTQCHTCGWIAMCPQCYLPATLHADMHKLVCHTCGFKQAVPIACPQCGEPDIIHKGIGTKLIASELRPHYPKANIARFDNDTAVAEQLHNQYQAVYDGRINIIVGTQIIAKGLDLPKLQVVGVVQADSGLTLPDYQAEERVFQLIHQVSGRVGRHSAETHVIVQTFQPTHPSVALGITKDYDGFYEHATKQRQKSVFPPFCHLLKLTCAYSTEQGAIRASKAFMAELKQKFGAHITLLGPAPAFYERLGGQYRWQIIVKAPSRVTLLQIAKTAPQKWYVDIDPQSLL